MESRFLSEKLTKSVKGREKVKTRGKVELRYERMSNKRELMRISRTTMRGAC